MNHGVMAWMELLVVLAFLGVWAVLEWMGRRLDRQKAERERAEAAGERPENNAD